MQLEHGRDLCHREPLTEDHRHFFFRQLRVTGKLRVVACSPKTDTLIKPARSLVLDNHPESKRCRTHAFRLGTHGIDHECCHPSSPLFGVDPHPYQLVPTGLPLNDSTHHSDGLLVRPGEYREAVRDALPPITLGEKAFSARG